MKIRIMKASGAEVELSDVAGIEIAQAGTIAVFRFDPFGHPHSSFRLEVRGENIAIRDGAITWPRKDLAIG